MSGEFFVTDKISFTPSLNYFHSKSEFVKYQGSFNPDFHFYLPIDELPISLYAIAGLSYLNMKLDYEIPFAGYAEKINYAELGVTGGLGVAANKNNLVIPFVEAKYYYGRPLGSRFDEPFNKPGAIFSAGARFRINQ